MNAAVLAIDQGTTATKAMVVSSDGAVLSIAERPVRVRSGANGSVEVDPYELLRSAVLAGREAFDAADRPVLAVGLANQGETVLAWDRLTGEPKSPAIVWHDRRSSSVCRQLAGARTRLRELTGLHLDPYFSAPKMAWLRGGGLRSGVITTSDTWLVHQLTGAFVTDLSTASRSMLLDLRSLTWSDEAWSIFDLDEDRPQLVANDEIVGRTRHFGPELPVAGLIIDQQASLWAQGCVARGQAKCTFGTGAFLLANSGSNPVISSQRLASSVAWKTGGATCWCLDGQAYTVGAAVDWLTRVGLLIAVEGLDAVLESTPGTGGVSFLPALAGLGAPHWLVNATAGFAGLTLATTADQMVCAVAEGIAFLVAELADAIAVDLADPLVELSVDGGLTRSARFLQLQADVLGIPLRPSSTIHATGLGCAELALLAVAGERFPEQAGVRESVVPSSAAPERRGRRDAWKAAVGLSGSCS